MPVDRESPRQSRPARPAPAQYGCRRAREIAGIIIPTRSMIIKNSAIFHPQVTGAIAAMATPNAIMETRTSASLPRLMRACSRSPRNMLWRGCDGVLKHHGTPALAMQAGVRAALLEGNQSLSRRRPDRVAADDKLQYGTGRRPLRVFDPRPISLTV